MDINAQKEQFSRAFVQAVASVAGFAWSQPSVDEDSVDLTLAAKGGGGTIRSPKVDLQLKCHAASTPTDDHISFPLKVKNYEELRDDTVLVPRLLVVVLVPDDVGDWLSDTESELSLRRSGYWVNLRGEPATQNSSTVSVQIPRGQRLNPDGLRGIMQRIGSGESP